MPQKSPTDISPPLPQKIRESDLPDDLDWWIPRNNEGQIVEVWFADGKRGGRYRSIVDRSLAPNDPERVKYHRLKRAD